MFAFVAAPRTVVACASIGLALGCSKPSKGQGPASSAASPPAVPSVSPAPSPSSPSSVPSLPSPSSSPLVPEAGAPRPPHQQVFTTKGGACAVRVGFEGDDGLTKALSPAVAAKVSSDVLRAAMVELPAECSAPQDQVAQRRPGDCSVLPAKGRTDGTMDIEYAAYETFVSVVLLGTWCTAPSAARHVQRAMNFRRSDGALLRLGDLFRDEEAARKRIKTYLPNPAMADDPKALANFEITPTGLLFFGASTGATWGDRTAVGFAQVGDLLDRKGVVGALVR
jgi:hypothetical protein